MQEVHITFGVREEQVVEVFEFCSDPDGTALQWFRCTDQIVSIKDYTYLSSDRDSFSGRCSDAGEYHSQAGELLKRILRRAPNGATLATFDITGGVGTRTFNETVEVVFYS